MEYKLIENKKELDNYLQEIKNCKYFAIDTEFSRKNTYYPKLSLIQICFKPQLAIIIDCLSIPNIDDLIEVIYDPNIIKVFHSSRQDLEIFYYKKKFLPKNIFDTQLAVLLINFSRDISYEKMVKSLLNIDVDKSLKNSDWLKRPLSKKQIQYAGSDVLYLYEVYPVILKLLEKHNRLHWLEDLFIDLEDPQIYENRLTKDITKVSNDSSLTDLDLVYDLLFWRENLAKQLDLPRNKIIDLDKIKEIAKKSPHNNESLREITGCNLEELYINQLLDIILNKKKSSITIEKNHNLSKHQAEIYNILKILLSYTASINKVNESIIASNDDLINFTINKENSQTKLIRGWRFEIFGQFILDFLNEKKSIKIKDGKINLE